MFLVFGLVLMVLMVLLVLLLLWWYCGAYMQVEWILMRALSKGLIKGTMDQVDGTVNITWVQPRVLDIAQLGLLSAQLKGWTEK